MGISNFPGANIITDTEEHTGKFAKITCLADCTVTLESATVTKNGTTTLSGIALKAGTEIEGIYTSITQTTAGSLIAYLVP